MSQTTNQASQPIQTFQGLILALQSYWAEQGLSLIHI